MPLTGERAREYHREYMRNRRAMAKQAGKLVKQAVTGLGRPITTATDEVKAVSQHALNMVLKAHGLELSRIVGKVNEKLDATRYYNGKDETILAQDNDAQLRAAEIAIGLHERAGTIPSSATSAPGGNSVTIVEMHYHAPQAIVVGDSDNDCETLTLRKD